jgi:hypothetical protein
VHKPAGVVQSLLINFPAVTGFYYKHEKPGIADFTENAVISDTVSPKLTQASGQGFA